MAADSFVFYRSFYEAAQCLPNEERLALYDALCEYGINGTDSQPSGIVAAVFAVARPVIDANSQRRERGAHGGRPKKEKPMVLENAEKEKPMVLENAETEKPKVLQKRTLKKPNENVNENENENVNENENIKSASAIAVTELGLEFEDLWNRLPKRRGNKRAAFEAYREARQTGTTLADVQIGVGNYNGYVKAHNVEGRFILNASTFFVERRWLDDWSEEKPRDKNQFSAGMETHEYTDAEFAEFEKLN